MTIGLICAGLVALAALAAAACAALLLRARLADREAACRRLLDDKDAACRQLLAAKDEACARLLREKDEACARLVREKGAETERLSAAKERAFAETVKTLREQFANLAAQALAARSADLSAHNKSQLDAALKPLVEQMTRFQEATAKAQAANSGMGLAIHRDVEAIGRMARDLSGFATALRTGTRVQGRAGEDILAEKLRQAGLEEGVSFFLQRGTAQDRPDAQVCDTENRWLIIDSKVSLTAYIEYGEAQDEATKAARLAAHVASVRAKIDELARRRYPDVFAREHPDRNYLPVAAMFVPHEAALLAALAAEPSLWQRAAEGNVVLVTPLTLLAYLRLVYLAWQHERAARNQQAIVETARELLARMNTFLVAFEGFGRSIEGLRADYEAAKSTIVDQPRAHTIAKAAQRLLDLNVKLEGRKGRRLERAGCLKEREAGEEEDA